MISQSRLKEVLHYNHLTGQFTWLTDRAGNKVKGKIAGCVLKTGRGKAYIVIAVDNYGYKAHRLAFLWMTGQVPEQVDHLNGNGICNKWANLLSSNPRDNAKNHRKARNNTSGTTGVVWDKKINKWQAQIGVKISGKRKNIFLGSYENITDAIINRKMAEYHYGFSGNHGEDRPTYA